MALLLILLQANYPDDMAQGMWAKILRMLVFAKPHWKLYLLATGIALLQSAVGLTTPYITKLFFDDVLVNSQFALFIPLLIAMLAVYFVTRVMDLTQSYANTVLSQRINNEVKFALFNRLQNLHLEFFSEGKIGDLIYRITTDAPSVQSTLSTLTNGIVMNAFTVAATITIALSLSWQVTLLSLIVIPIYALAERFFLGRILEMRSKMIDSSVGIMDFVQESFSSYLTVKSYGKETKRCDEFARRTEDYNRLVRKELVTSSGADLLQGFILYLPGFIVLAYGGWQVLQGAMTIGTMIALQIYITQLHIPLILLVAMNRAVRFDMLSVDRVFKILDTQPKVKDLPGAKDVGNLNGTIRFEDVTFSFGDKQVIKNLSLAIKPNKITAIVGPSGIGKTTLAYLLLRFYEPDSGRVMINGDDLRKIKLASLRRQMGVVTQEPFLFNATIRENIAFGKPGASDLEVEKAATEASAHGFISKLPKAYDSGVGERGTKLSAGEKQRISLARALLQKYRILIIDEGLSSMDSHSEQVVMRALRKNLAGQTVILTTHRLSTLRDVDEVVVLEGGKIVERGGYDELVKKNGRFYELYKHQLGKKIK